MVEGRFLRKPPWFWIFFILGYAWFTWHYGIAEALMPFRVIAATAFIVSSIFFVGRGLTHLAWRFTRGVEQKFVLVEVLVYGLLGAVGGLVAGCVFLVSHFVYPPPDGTTEWCWMSLELPEAGARAVVFASFGSLVGIGYLAISERDRYLPRVSWLYWGAIMVSGVLGFFSGVILFLLLSMVFFFVDQQNAEHFLSDLRPVALGSAASVMIRLWWVGSRSKQGYFVYERERSLATEIIFWSLIGGLGGMFIWGI